ncbi:PhaM family polyhydroxyalkanoate granule multifunctional regulatory protein [Acidovorax sp. LjRoot194]|uniref:PhaM family polyhydroxyalkanoate granule multifunctional regulatory protein n=1 Tax=Acidovorax sp. LjRoot194 TaxID=3342280 RepID=UPI003ECE651A
MSDTSNFGFGKLVPGFDFLQSLAKGASSSIPQLPNLSNWVAPTISVEELEKRIDELKAVQFWLEQNSRALAATIQALEVQKMTLATLKGMNFSMGDVANAFKLKTADTVMSGVQKAAGTVSGAADAVAGAAARVASRAADAQADEAEEAEEEDDAPAAAPKSKADKAGKAKAASAAEPNVVDPMQWWGALTSQFQQIATNAMKDAAKQTAIDTTKNMATGLAKEAFKTASGMASQFAAKGLQTVQGTGKRASASSATKKAAPAAAKKSAPRKAAAKPAAKKSTSRTSASPRKRAG